MLITPYRFDMLMLSGQASLRPAKWASVLYEISFNQNGQAMEGEGFFSG